MGIYKGKNSIVVWIISCIFHMYSTYFPFHEHIYCAFNFHGLTHTHTRNVFFITCYNCVQVHVYTHIYICMYLYIVFYTHNNLPPFSHFRVRSPLLILTCALKHQLKWQQTQQNASATTCMHSQMLCVSYSKARIFNRKYRISPWTEHFVMRKALCLVSHSTHTLPLEFCFLFLLLSLPILSDFHCEYILHSNPIHRRKAHKHTFWTLVLFSLFFILYFHNNSIFYSLFVCVCVCVVIVVSNLLRLDLSLSLSLMLSTQQPHDFEL